MKKILAILVMALPALCYADGFFSIQDPTNKSNAASVNSDGSLNFKSVTAGVSKGGTNTPATVSVSATTTAALLSANTNRLEMHISNLTAGSCQIALSGTATATTGDTLASGGTLIEDRWTGAVSAFCTNAGNVAVQEITP